VSGVPNSRIGVVGLGAMGLPIAVRLHLAGLEPVCFDVRAPARKSAQAQGISTSDSLLELAERCDTVVTMLPTSRHVAEVSQLMRPALRRGGLLIDMTSGQPAQTRLIGEQLRELGVAMVDAPVSGNVSRAEKGDLAIMLGGEDEAKTRARPVLKPLARAIFDTGALGSGQAMKALNNLSSAAGFWIAAEVLTVGKRLGLDPVVMLQVLNASTGSNNSTQNKFLPFVLSGSFDGRFALPLMVKDLGIAAELAQEAGGTASLTAAVHALWAQALQSLGENSDHTEAARFVAERAGVRLWPEPMESVAKQPPPTSKAGPGTAPSP
jgi:3-hydroxyisobutyrate dehydrogenase